MAVLVAAADVVSVADVADVTVAVLTTTVAIEDWDVAVTDDTALELAMTDVVELLVLEPDADVWSVMYDGAGLAVDGSLSAPFPQGMAAPGVPGCVAFGGGTVVPPEPSI